MSVGGSVEPYTTTKGRLWMVRYRDEDNRQRKKRGFRTKRDATLALADLQVRLARGEWVDPQAGKITVGSLWDVYVDTQADLKESTRSKLRFSWSTHVKPKWDTREVGKIRPSMVRSWVTEMQSAGVGPGTIETALDVLRGCLAIAVEDRALASNPASGVRAPRREHVARGYLTHQQTEALAVECGRDATVVRFLAYTGLRWGEMAALRVSDFDMLRRRVQISRAVSEVEGRRTWSTPKTREKRSVPFPAFLVDEIAAQMVGRGREDLVFARTVTEFSHLRVSLWRPRVFKPAVARCQEVDPTFPTVSPHDLRHTAASLAISAGANVKAVQTMLGHASAAMTLDTYADLFPDDLDAVAGALDSARQSALRVRATITM
ncbi:site-specific integrase [Dietzia cinnamea]|uniref:site-specific integrase n=1 Tax=Dietzia cinnamea TaxID=321318 RepID=UPI0021A5F799|nr:site-specific integrase [Dietzia cinnamea]MCT1884974.1 site-specific integrase [Dietzia cinnamea]